MKLIHNDVIGADALTPKTSATNEAPVKQGDKPSAFQFLLKNVGTQHGKHVPVKAVDKSETKPDAGSKLNAKADSGVSVSPGPASDTEATLVAERADSSAPVLWAQMQMSQAQVAEIVATEALGTNTAAAGGPADVGLSLVQLSTQAGAELVTTNGALIAAANSATVAPANPVAAGFPGETGAKALSQSTAADPVELDSTEVGLGASPTVGGSKLHGGHGGGRATGWMAELGNLTAAVTSQKQGSDQANATLEKLSTQMHTTGVLAAASQSAAIDGLQTDQRRVLAFAKGAFEPGQALYTSQGMDMTSQANQTAVSLGVSATVPVDAAPETAVATQVAVWVSQNIQSAELKLDAQGSDPVEVSISMAGNQATVEFRCDTAETRDMLNRAADQLDAMLQSEGIILSGVSVGASSQQQARDQASASRQGGAERSGRTGSPSQSGVSTQTINLVQRARVSEGSVDVFV